MQLMPSSEVKIHPIGKQAADLRSQVNINGRISIIDGVVLEAAYRLDADDPVKGYVFFLTNDIPSEEVLSITLTDDNLNTLDVAYIGWVYNTGFWRDPAVEGAGKISFNFIDNKRWTLSILPEESFRLPFVGEPKGVFRKINLRRHFKLSAV